MEAFFDFLKVVFLGGFALLAIFLVLLALPKSKLRTLFLEVAGWFGVAGSAVSVISPIDPIPDFIPVLGQMDDLGMIIVGICSAIIIATMKKQRRQIAIHPKTD